MIAELLGVASWEALGVDLHEGRLREKSVRAVLLLLLHHDRVMINLDKPLVPFGNSGFIIAGLLL